MSDSNKFGASHAFMTGDGADAPDVLEQATSRTETPPENVELSPLQLESQQRLEAERSASRRAAAQAQNSSLYDPEHPNKILSDEEELAEQKRISEERTQSNN